MVDKERLTKYRDREITNAEQLIEASGIDRKYYQAINSLQST